MRCSASYWSGSALHAEQRWEERVKPWSSHGEPCLGAAVPTTSRLLKGSDGWPQSFPKQHSLELCHWSSTAVSRGLAGVEGVTSAQPVSLKRYTSQSVRQLGSLLQKLRKKKNLQSFDLSTPGFLRVSSVLKRTHLILFSQNIFSLWKQGKILFPEFRLLSFLP